MGGPAGIGKAIRSPFVRGKTNWCFLIFTIRVLHQNTFSNARFLPLFQYYPASSLRDLTMIQQETASARTKMHMLFDGITPTAIHFPLLELPLPNSGKRPAANWLSAEGPESRIRVTTNQIPLG